LDHTLTGTLRLHKALESGSVERSRDVIVYLPPDYNETHQRYPVLYLHDGQNLFDPATAFAGQDWGLDELAEELIQSGQIQPIVIVGVYNAGEKRMAEYTHVRDRRGRGGRARKYAQFLIQDLKPFIDSEYRTLTDCANTGLGGSSLGGLVTLYLGLHHPDTFGKLIVMSPAVWWANRAILREVRKLRERLPQKIWLDIGTCEGQDPEVCVKNVEDLAAALVSKGWEPGYDFKFVEDQGAGHNENAWGYRMGDALKFLFPPEKASR
jgi:predicted alpha/beta superfamily hydrolase